MKNKKESVPEPWTCTKCEALNDCDNIECGYCGPENKDEEDLYAEYEEEYF